MPLALLSALLTAAPGAAQDRSAADRAYARGEENFTDHRTAAAVMAWQGVLKIDPDHAPTRAAMSAWGAFLSAAPASLVEAVRKRETLAPRLRREPGKRSPEELYKAGMASFTAWRLDDAKALWEEAARKAPAHLEAEGALKALARLRQDAPPSLMARLHAVEFPPKPDVSSRAAERRRRDHDELELRRAREFERAKRANLRAQ